MSAVQRVLPGFHWLPGVMPEDVLRHPDIANAFVFERDGTAYLVDTGAGPRFRRAVADFFGSRRYDSVTLINTQPHVDHACNNDLLSELDAESRSHLIHEEGVPYLNPREWIESELRLASRRYSPFRFDAFPLNVGGVLLGALARVAPEAAFALYARAALRKFEPIRTRTPFLRPLPLEERTVLEVGGVTFVGWHAGELLLSETGGHSPGSIAVYDPRERVLLVGDLTYEYNPLWPSGTYGWMIEDLREFRSLAAAGEVAILGDGHSPRLFFGASEVLPFLDGLIDTHARRRSAAVGVAKERDTSSVETVRDTLIAEDAEFGYLAREKEFPRTYCFTRAMVAVALREMQEDQRLGTTMGGGEY